MLRLSLAAVLFAAMTVSAPLPARAGTDCGGGNDFTNPGSASPDCGGGGSNPAPLPLAGIPALIALAGGAGALVLRRRAA